MQRAILTCSTYFEECDIISYAKLR